MNSLIDKRIVIKKYKPKGKRAFYYIMKCLCCSKHFEIIARCYNRGRGIYCGHKCNNKRKSGKYNGRWRGGKRDGYGYVLINKLLVPEKYHYLAKDGHQNYIREHRLVMAKKIGRKLKTEELVHHLNGIRDDNRPENLIIQNNQNHEKHTLWKLAQERIKKLEKKIKHLEQKK